MFTMCARSFFLIQCLQHQWWWRRRCCYCLWWWWWWWWTALWCHSRSKWRKNKRSSCCTGIGITILLRNVQWYVMNSIFIIRFSVFFLSVLSNVGEFSRKKKHEQATGYIRSVQVFAIWILIPYYAWYKMCRLYETTLVKENQLQVAAIAKLMKFESPAQLNQQFSTNNHFTQFFFVFFFLNVSVHTKSLKSTLYTHNQPA